MARVSDLLAAGRTYSFEFFPPKTDGAQLSLGHTIAELEPLAPSFVSVTYGAGGTHQVSAPTRSSAGCAGRRRSPRWPTSRARATPAPRSPRSSTTTGPPASRTSSPSAAIRPTTPTTTGRATTRTRPTCSTTSAAPTSRSASPPTPRSTPARPTGRPTGASWPPSWPRADFAITQFFFEAEHYVRLVDELAALGVDKPVLPGHHADHQRRPDRAGWPRSAAPPSPAGWSSGSTASRTPPRCAASASTSPARCAPSCSSCGAPGLHFYTLNRSTASREIYANLGLGSVPGGAGRARDRLGDPSPRVGPAASGDQPRALPPRPRRHAGARRARRDGVPRQPVVAAGRLPRRRGVLRDHGLPDHAAADRRARAHGHGQPARVLHAPGPPAAAGAVHAAGRRSRSTPRCSTATRSASCAATSSPRSPTCRTGTRSGSARATPRPATSRRCGTSGAWPSRSSSTWCGRW